MQVKDCIEPFCIGCFSECDARSFYEQLTAGVDAADRALLPPFEQAYRVVGGHPMHIRELVECCLKERLLQRGLIRHDACVQYHYLLQRVAVESRSIGTGWGIDSSSAEYTLTVNVPLQNAVFPQASRGSTAADRGRGLRVRV